MYEEQILRILLDVGVRGISIKMLTKHVYNFSCTLFYQPEYSEVYRAVQRYVYGHSRRRGAMLTPTGVWGRYRLTPSGKARAQQICQKSGLLREPETDGSEDGGEEASPSQDLSLSLF